MAGILRGAAWLLIAGVIVRLLDAHLEDKPLLALAIGAFAVDFIAQRLGVRWSSSDDPSQPAYRKALRGFAIGLGLTAAVVLTMRLIGRAQIGWGSPSLFLALSAARPFLQAMRDELLFRGIPLAIAGNARIPDRYALPFAALLGATPLLSSPDIRPEALLLTIGSGLFFALLWWIGRGGLLAWGAHASWLFAVDIAIRGSLLDISFAAGALAPTARASSLPAWVAAAVFVCGAVVLTKWRAQPERA